MALSKYKNLKKKKKKEKTSYNRFRFEDSHIVHAPIINTGSQSYVLFSRKENPTNAVELDLH